MSDNVTLTPEEQAQLDEQRKGAPPVETEAPEVEEVPQETAADDAAGEEHAEAGKTVPLPALREERERRKEVERRLAETERRREEDRQRYEERFNAVLQRLGQPEQKTEQTPAIPPLAEDPAAHIVGTMQAQGADVQQIKQALAQFHAQQQQQQAAAQIQQRAMAMEQEFRSNTQDYDAAVNYLKDFRSRQLKAVGWSDPVQIHAQITQEAFGIAAHALQQGKNPAEVIYEMSKASGYTAPAPTTPDPAEKLATIAKGQQQSRGLGNMRGSGPSPMTAARLMEMSNDEFLEAMKKSSDARKLLGA